MSLIKTIALTACISFAAISAQAATVLQGVTKAADGPFTIEGGGTKVVVTDPANAWITTPIDGSEWIWDEALVTPPGGSFGGPVTFVVSFLLDGFDVSTAALSGFFAVDDLVTITLNDYLIGADVDAYNPPPANWADYQAYGTSNASFFNEGLNTLKFTVYNTGGYPAGLNATVLVEAAAVPVPAALPLLGGAIAGLGMIARKRKRQAELA